MLESAIAWLQHADPLAVYAFLFAIAYLENVVPPIPGDLPVAFIGYLVYGSNITFAGAVLFSSLGSSSGFMTVFFLSRILGLKLYSDGASPVQHTFHKSIHKFFPPSDMELLRQKFATHGYLAVLVNRFLFGSRAVISVMAGLMHLNVFKVLAAALLSSTAWNVLLLYGGFLLGSNWTHIGGYLALYSIPVTIAFAVLLVFSVWKFIQERKRKHD